MKKALLFLVPFCVFAQQKITFPLDNSLRDATHSVASVSLIDSRTDQDLGKFTDKQGSYVFSLPDNPGEAISAKFDKDNKNKGTRNLVLQLQDLHIFTDNSRKNPTPDAHIAASVFEQKGDLYYFIKSINIDAASPEMQGAKSPETIGNFVGMYISNLLKSSYAAPVSSVGITKEQLPNYYTVLSAAMPVFSTGLKDGVYQNYADFFNVRPAEGYVLERNADGKVVRAKNGSEKIPGYKIYAYVENGKAYKNTFSGFLPMEKDEKGFYLNSNRGELEAVPANNTLGMFGLIGGVAGAIEQNARQNKAKKAEKSAVYIDPLSGEYIY